MASHSPLQPDNNSNVHVTTQQYHQQYHQPTTTTTTYTSQEQRSYNNSVNNMSVPSERYHQSQVTPHTSGQGRVVDVRVVGHEVGVERLVSTSEHVVSGEKHVINERVTHHHKRVPKKVVREEVVEKTIVIPEVIQVEEWVEEDIEVEDRVIEVAKVIQIEKVVEVPEIEIVEKIIEVPEHVVREKIREVPRIEVVERVVEIPIIQTVEKIVEIPQIEYRDVPVEKIVEVPEVLTEEIPREVAIPQFVDRPIEQIQVIEESYTVERKIPVPIEAETIVEYALPNIKPKYNKKVFPVYLPRFVEVPIARQFADQGMLAAAETYNARVENLTAVKPAVALGEIEMLATEIKDSDLVNRHTHVTGNKSLKDLYTQAWETGSFEYFGGMVTGTSITGPLQTANGYSVKL